MNWNGEAFIRSCLESLRHQTYRDFDVIVVDNGSEDGSRSVISDEFRDVTLLELNRNAGFAQGANVGIQESSGVLIMLLNNDAIADPRWLEGLVRAAESHPAFGSFQSKILSLRDGGKIDSAGITFQPNGTPTDRGIGKPDGPEFELPVEIFGACAGAAAYRREMLQEIGLFDPRYFAEFEDVDLAFRARIRGWRSLFVPDSVAWHIRGASLGRVPYLARHARHMRNLFFLEARHYPIRWFVAAYTLLAQEYPTILRAHSRHRLYTKQELMSLSLVPIAERLRSRCLPDQEFRRWCGCAALTNLRSKPLGKDG